MSNSKTTKEIIDEFVGTLDFGDRATSYIDREELYAFEEKVGTDLFHFTPDQAKEMIHSFRSRRGRGGEIRDSKLSVASFKVCKMYFKALFQYYIENYEIISNPFTTATFKGTDWMHKDGDVDEQFTDTDLRIAIQRAYATFGTERGRYIEAIVLLYYEGIQSADDIVFIKESDVDFNASFIKTKSGFIRPSKRCLELFKAIHEMNSMPGAKYELGMESYRNSYFKIPVRKSKIYEINDRTLGEITTSINKNISKDLSMAAGRKILAKDIFYLGLFNRMVSDFGRKRVEEILSSYRNEEDVSILKLFLERNNIPPSGYVTYREELKRFL